MNEIKEPKQWSVPTRYMVLILVILITGILLWLIRGVLEPLIIAAFIAYLINPAVNLLTTRTQLSRKVAVNLVFFFSLGLVIAVPATFTPIFFDELKQVVADLLSVYNQAVSWLAKPMEIFGMQVSFGQLANRLALFRAEMLTNLPDQALQLLGKTSLGAVWVIIVLVAIYYCLAEWPRLREGMIRSFPGESQEELGELYRRVRSIWMNYLRGQLLLMLIVGVVFTIAWAIIGIPGALVLGVVAGFLTIIPDVGPFIASMLAVGVALLEGSSWISLPNIFVALIVLAVYLVLIMLKNFLLRPYIMGRSVHMHEALVLISILLATILWGILGALLIVPVLATAAVIFDYLRRKILGMVPFPPTESFIKEHISPKTDLHLPSIKGSLRKKKSEPKKETHP